MGSGLTFKQRLQSGGHHNLKAHDQGREQTRAYPKALLEVVTVVGRPHPEDQTVPAGLRLPAEGMADEGMVAHLLEEVNRLMTANLQTKGTIQPKEILLQEGVDLRVVVRMGRQGLLEEEAVEVEGAQGAILQIQAMDHPPDLQRRQATLLGNREAGHQGH